MRHLLFNPIHDELVTGGVDGVMVCYYFLFQNIHYLLSISINSFISCFTFNTGDVHVDFPLKVTFIGQFIGDSNLCKAFLWKLSYGSMTNIG